MKALTHTIPPDRDLDDRVMVHGRSLFVEGPDQEVFPINPHHLRPPPATRRLRNCSYRLFRLAAAALRMPRFPPGKFPYTLDVAILQAFAISAVVLPCSTSTLILAFIASVTLRFAPNGLGFGALAALHSYGLPIADISIRWPVSLHYVRGCGRD